VSAARDHEEMHLAKLLTNFRDGPGIGWPAEFAYLRTFHHEQIAELTISIAARGFDQPILLGAKYKRVRDGHHRLCVASSLNWLHVPILFDLDEEDDE
jgi:ParB-like chromosome segregation protein Spo0J